MHIQPLFQVSLTAILISATLVGCNSETEPMTDDVLDESWFTLNEGEDEQVAMDAPAEPGEAKAKLAVNLQPGDRFPLQKVVEKTLTQSTIQGQMESQERIEFLMAVTVEEVRDQHKKFAVQYSRVKYDSQLHGQTIHYDSLQPPYPIPDAALVYHGMINNGFSFWVGPDNKITDVVDFNSFLQRCLQHVPASKADAVSQILARYSHQQDGVANFIDDTIGLLPYDPSSPDGSSVVRLGGHWSKTRQFNDPVPMLLNNTYTLRELTDEQARVEVIGQISPAAAVNHGGANQLSVQIRDGHSAGTCTIDRKTGLPLESRVDHMLNMVVQAEDVQIEQQKRVVTSIRMYPGQTAAQLSRLTADQNSIQPASATSNNVNRIQPAGYESEYQVLE